MTEIECNLHLRGKNVPYPRTCTRCGLGPCHVWRDQAPPIGADPKPEVPKPPSGGATESRPDPAYATALSEQAILVEARAKAFELGMKLAAQSDRAETIQFPGLIDTSNRILRYLLEGK